MGRSTQPLLPAIEGHLVQLGARLRRARVLRGITRESLSERTNLSLMTLKKIEDGNAAVAIGSYLLVLQILGFEADLDAVASKDTTGADYAYISLGGRARSRRTKGAKAPKPALVPSGASQATRSKSPENEDSQSPSSRKLLRLLG